MLRRLARSLDRHSPQASLAAQADPLAHGVLPDPTQLSEVFRAELDDPPRRQTGPAAKGEEVTPANAAASSARMPLRILNRPSGRVSTADRPVPSRGDDRRVRRGQVAIEARLDLHGSFQDQAHVELARFLEHQRERLGGGAVLVITGKGRQGTGVLRQRFPEWIDGPLCRHNVAGYATAHPRHGGEGAFYVFLKPRHPTHGVPGAP